MLGTDEPTTASHTNQSETFSSAETGPPAAGLPSLLVVEDDRTVRKACQAIAVGVGFRVWTADSVRAARLALQAHSIDIVLLDVRLGTGRQIIGRERVRMWL